MGNFEHLNEFDMMLATTGRFAERYFADDANTALIKVRQFAERLTFSVADRVGIEVPEGEDFLGALRRLQIDGSAPREVLDAEFGGARAILPDLKGLHDIRRLLERPGEEVHCLDLAEREAEGPGDAILDERARTALRSRIRDLQEDLAEAEDMNDIGRAERLRAEMDTLVETLSRALGLGGRGRRLGDLSEKARTAVTWRIRHAQRRIEAAHPALGRHLANALRTGTFCLYRPEAPVVWRFEAA